MRNVTIGTISLNKLPHGNEQPLAGIEERFAEAEPFLAQAAARRVDFVCLPEVFATHGVREWKRYLEKVPDGPISCWCAALAKKYNLNLVASIYSGNSRNYHNTGVIFNRAGKLAGRYHKIHIAPDEEARPGKELPVFNIDGIKVGLQICYDLNFPEGARVLAIQGAELLFFPTMWLGPSAYFVDCLTRTRAMENFVYLVSSNHVYLGGGQWQNPRRGTSAIIGWDGTILAETGPRVGLAVAIMDLDEPRRLQSLRRDHFAARRPECYGAIASRSGVKKVCR